jgi:hypothetical protein
MDKIISDLHSYERGLQRLGVKDISLNDLGRGIDSIP